MRINLIAFFVALAFINVSASVKGQTINLKVKGMSIEKVFEAIKSQSGYGFWYEKKTLQNAGSVTADMSNASLKSALDDILSKQNLSYTIVDRTIFIKEKEKSVIDRIGEYFQNIVITGKVTDEKGVPVSGANVTIKGTTKSVISDSRGMFTIIVPRKGAVLQFKYIGFQTYEYTVVESKMITVALKEGLAQLDEVSVVSNGYETISKERAAGAFATISSEQIMSTPSVNLMERLQGKVPGVDFDVRNNTIKIRGVNNYAIGSGSPLIVIDGFPMIAPGDQQRLTTFVSGVSTGNSILSTLNPADIDQITFLKDASAASIWGAAASNGVIVITTKRGRGEIPSINLSYNLGVSQHASLDQLKWMNAAQYIDLEKEMVDKRFLSDPSLVPSYNVVYTKNNSEATEWMYRVTRTPQTATPAQRDAALANLGSRNALGQVEDYLLQNAVNHQLNLSVSGATDVTSYFISGNYTKDNPVYKSNYGSNAFINAMTTSSFFNKKITVRAGINYQFTKARYNGAAVDALSQSETALRPYDLLVDENGNTIQRTNMFYTPVAQAYVNQGYLPFGYNAVDELNYSNSISKTNVIRMLGGVNAKIFNWLDADLSVMGQRSNGKTEGLNELNSYQNRIFLNTGTTIVNGKPFYNVPYGGTASQSQTDNYDTGVRGQLNANVTWKTDHQFNALAGAEIRETGGSNSSVTRYGYDEDTRSIKVVNPTVSYPTIYGYNTTLGNNLSGLSLSRKRFFSYYGNAAYSYKSKYILTGSARVDDYTLLGIDRSKRVNPFWSAAVKWNASKEDFFSSVDWISNLAFRTSYGTSGNIPQGGSNITLLSVSSNVDPRTQQPIASISSPGNSDLGWETTKSFNFGTDFSLFKGRLSSNVDFFSKKSSGILYSLPFNATYGWSSLQFNTATSTGHGYEFGLNGLLIKAKDFHWNSTFNFSYVLSKVTDARFENNASSLAGNSQPVNGLPLGTLFVYRWAGLDNLGQSQIYDKNNNIIKNTTNLLPANFTREDLVKAGLTYAPYSGGFFNTFRYKGLEASVQMTYYFGHVFLKQSINNYPTYEGAFSGILGRQEDLAYRWRKAGDEASTNVPGLTGITNNSILRYRYSDLLVRKADHIRLQQISLAYNLPLKYLPKNSFKSLTVNASARNLGLIWAANKEGIDPQYINTGNFSNLAPTPNYVFGINASF
ncbi:SusC/RagA family TonB-linked outer membrane protein [Pedobacter sp. MC2016-14]|uniref:SusC/RagA family TonB-linked outer membrane protein n=1 Tax=Pedobacter sp. MC2016-14 TaxID=2897327 RepID=UPI001E60D0F4|nr:SusC/RagA family TonB-linked outer membrane protein [Pedobacter sp. MC2016-14]MCD0488596.1 SusC/RagA family TonB-linked outer membrane protein [Pedobacter sp. MC2016-14]